MKNVIKIVVVIVGIMFMGCNLEPQAETVREVLTVFGNYDSELGEKASGHILTYDNDWKTLENFQEIASWISDNVTYKADINDTWSNPQVVLDRGYGDCDDFALLFMNIAYIVFGIEMDFVLVFQESRTYEQGGDINHAEVRYNGDHYCIYSGNKIRYEQACAYSYDFNQVFSNIEEIDSILKE